MKRVSHQWHTSPRTKITCLDNPDETGASYIYSIHTHGMLNGACVIRFQKGPHSAGITGVDLEDVMAVCSDRMTDLLTGPGKCEELDHAKNYLDTALYWLNRLKTKQLTAKGKK